MATIKGGETLELTTESGRKVFLYLHECPSCVSLDVYTERGRSPEVVSSGTGLPQAAPVGVFAWRQGTRTVPGDGTVAPEEGSHRWPAFQAVTLVWNDGKEG